MNLSATIAQIILDMLEQTGDAEIQRNELAQNLGCVPSQINYVLASRFTPEQGYIVESRRGGGGYIRIRRVKLDRGAVFMHVYHTVGAGIDEATCRAHIGNLLRQSLLTEEAAALFLAATADAALRDLPAGWEAAPAKDAGPSRDSVRASVFKQMLLIC
ncbi:MAG: CtsR family transcriptional regulator [Oscillospiraceae bacterium]|jgi:transcriptional regulator CtsR|nr:CtsR family transcriptional regulator [Oscillospiraceae bacterium]